MHAYRMSSQRAVNLLRTMAGASCRCPAHSDGGHTRLVTNTKNTDYAFEMACSNIRFGEGVTQVSINAYLFSFSNTITHVHS